jgi:signal peptidase II
VRIILIFIIVFLTDQVTKHLIRYTFTLGKSVSVLGQFLKFTYIENPGIAFGIRVKNSTIFTILSILACIGIAIYLYLHWKQSMGFKISLTLILGGAVGNLYDRIIYKRVVDFIDVGIGNVRWPVFNIADSTVVIGMIILLFYTFRQERENNSQEVI